MTESIISKIALQIALLSKKYFPCGIRSVWEVNLPAWNVNTKFLRVHGPSCAVLWIQIHVNIVFYDWYICYVDQRYPYNYSDFCYLSVLEMGSLQIGTSLQIYMGMEGWLLPSDWIVPCSNFPHSMKHTNIQQDPKLHHWLQQRYNFTSILTGLRIWKISAQLATQPRRIKKELDYFVISLRPWI